MAAYFTYSDQELMALLKQGDHQAFAMIYKRYNGLLYVHAVKLLKNEDEAQDVIQDLFASLWQKSSTLNIEVPLNSYLYKIARNKIFDIFRHQKISNAYVEKFVGIEERGEWITDEKVREKELIAAINEGISLLPAKMRKVFEMSRVENKSHREIAAELNISDKTVKTQINNALKLLRVKISSIVLLFTFIILLWSLLGFPSVVDFNLNPINFQFLYNLRLFHP